MQLVVKTSKKYYFFGQPHAYDKGDCMKKQINASIKLSNDLYTQLTNLAELRQRSVHSLMLQALETYVTRELKREAWRQEGIAAWDEYQRTGLHLTNDEVLDWLGRTAAGENVEMPECHL